MQTALRTKQRVSVKSELARLQNEVGALRATLISFLGEDREGAYRPEFVRDILEAARQKPTRTFTTVGNFLTELRQI